ncbi:hypothetical protein ACWDYJ_11920 [Streptomyces sp. NPDC003042]
MSNGFPTGRFRIVNVETGECLSKRSGQNIGDESATVGKYSYGDPDLLIGALKGTEAELWSSDGGMLVNAVPEPPHRGNFALRLNHDDRSRWVSLVGTGSIHATRWEFTDGHIKSVKYGLLLAYQPRMPLPLIGDYPEGSGPRTATLSELLGGSADQSHPLDSLFAAGAPAKTHQAWRLDKG